jgi:hypothetical protein
MGKLARPGDWQSIGAALVDVLDQREQYLKPRADIEQKFSFQETVDCYEEQFRQYATRRSANDR